MRGDDLRAEVRTPRLAEAEWQRLADEASEGPWTYNEAPDPAEFDDYGYGGEIRSPNLGHGGEQDDLVASSVDYHDAAFIAAAREAVPALLTEVARLRDLPPRPNWALREVERLREWKAEAMAVLAEWEKVWEALGKPGELGTSKALSALAEVERLRGERDDLLALAREDTHRRGEEINRAERAEAKVARVERVVLKWSCPPLENPGNTLVLRDLRDALRDDA